MTEEFGERGFNSQASDESEMAIICDPDPEPGSSQNRKARGERSQGHSPSAFNPPKSSSHSISQFSSCHPSPRAEDLLLSFTRVPHLRRGFIAPKVGSFKRSSNLSLPTNSRPSFSPDYLHLSLCQSIPVLFLVVIPEGNLRSPGRMPILGVPKRCQPLRDRPVTTNT